MRWSERRTAVRSTFYDDFHTSTRRDARHRPPSLILFSLDVVSLFAYSVGLSGFGRVVVFSFLATQLIVWLLEIRAVGFRTWMHDSKTHSYVGYIRRYGRHEWRRFVSIFGAVLVTFALIWRLRP